MKKKQEIELSIEKLAFGGKGITRVDNRVIFVDGALPGDHIVGQIKKIKGNYAEARLIKLLQPSRLRIPASCKHFGSCGGCKWQNLDYRQQLRFKREQVIESLKHISGVEPETVAQTLPSPLIYGYRNKTEFSFTDKRWLTSEELKNPNLKKGFALGFHAPGGFDRVMHIEKCWLQDEIMNNILTFSQQYFSQCSLPVFNLQSHQGLLRFLVIRKSFTLNNYMVNIVTFDTAKEYLDNYARDIVQRFPGVTSVINTVNRRVAQIAYGEEEYLLFGNKVLKEKLGNFDFEISANSFFQTNPLQAENLYRLVQEYVGNENDLILDLYSGTGAIALFVSHKADRVIGYELIEGAVEDAYRSCRRNNIFNCEFIAGDIRERLSAYKEEADVVICDPPRAGMHPDVVKSIIRIKPQNIVYVSCNPTTMARDLTLIKEGYKLKKVQPLDMFPHTYHIESVALLEKK